MGCAAGKDQNASASEGNPSQGSAKPRQQQQQQSAPASAPANDNTSTTAPTGGGDKPFADDGPAFADSTPDDSSSDDPFHAAMVNARRGRSASVAKLQEIAKKREKEGEHDGERGEDDNIEPQSPESDRSPGDAPTLSPSSLRPQQRHRRLSSIYNDFSSQMSEFWKQRDEGGGEIEEEAQEQTLKRMFSNLDITHSGFITLDVLEEGFRRMGLTSSSTQVREMFRLADKEHNGRLGFPQFFSFFKAMASLDTVKAEEADELAALKAGPLPVRRRNQSISVRFLRSFTIRPFGSFGRRVKSIAISPSRPLLAAFDRDDRVAHLFNSESGEEVRRLVGHQDSMLSVVFSPDRKTVATASRDNTLTIWDCTVGHEMCSCRHPGVVTACDFSFDGKYIYTGCQDNLVRKIVANKGRCHRLMEKVPSTTPGVIVAIGAQQQHDSRIIVTRSCDKCAYVLDADRLCVVAALMGHTALVWHCSYNHDDSLMITQCDKFIKLWSSYDNNLRFSVPAATMPGPRKPPGRRSRLWTTVAFGPPDFSSLILAAANDSMLYMLRIDTGEVLVALEVRSTVYALATGAVKNNVFFGDDIGNIFELQLQ
jgi:hypothetical protein